MTDANELHRAAMQFADDALAAKRAGQSERSQKLFRKAFEAEREAAHDVPDDIEPSRSVLFRSAAALALECGESEEAERLARRGMEGSPPSSIRVELQEILLSVESRRALGLQGGPAAQSDCSRVEESHRTVWPESSERVRVWLDSYCLAHKASLSWFDTLPSRVNERSWPDAREFVKTHVERTFFELDYVESQPFIALIWTSTETSADPSWKVALHAREIGKRFRGELYALDRQLSVQVSDVSGIVSSAVDAAEKHVGELIRLQDDLLAS